MPLNLEVWQVKGMLNICGLWGYFFTSVGPFFSSPGGRAPGFHHSPLMGAIAQALQQGPVFRTLAQRPPMQKEAEAYLKFEGGRAAVFEPNRCFMAPILSSLVGFNQSLWG